MDDEAKWFFFTAILFANLAFLVAWTLVLAQELKGYCRLKYPQCYLWCCLCNRKDLLQHEQRARKLDGQLENFVQEIEEVIESKNHLHSALTKAKGKLLNKRLFLDQRKFEDYVHYSRRILSTLNFSDELYEAKEGKASGKYRMQNPPTPKEDQS